MTLSNEKTAKQPFKFYTRLHLSELTGLKAKDIVGLLRYIKKVPGSSIYHHTHRFLQIHQYLSPEPPNDFAYWVSETLGEDELGEKLASIDTVQFTTIRGLRDKIASTIEEYIKANPSSKSKFVNPNEEFYFIKTLSFIIPTPYVAHTLKEFADTLDKITIDSIYFHIFEARLRLERGTNDFSFWLGTSLGEEELAGKLSGLDPYTRTMNDLRGAIIKLVRSYL